MSEFFRRIRYLLHRGRFDRELANDMEFHREMAAREGGVPFGNTLRLREEARDAWGWTWLERLSQDLRYALRMFRKSPGFTAAAILMLAIGIGANVAAFGFFDLLVLRPLHVREPATLLRFHRRAPQGYAFVLPYGEMSFFRDHSRTLSAILALNTTKLAGEGEDKQLTAHFVTPEFFSELGAAAILGRALDLARDETTASEPVVVLTQGFWRRHFGADPLVVGKVMRLNGKPATIVGVVASDFSGLSMASPDLWAPLKQQPYFVHGSQLLTDLSPAGSGVQMWGRLRPGFTPKAAEQELGALAAELRKQHPVDIWEKETLPSEPGGYASSLMVGTRTGTGTEGNQEIYPIASMVGALCLMILAVACANLGSLLLARGVAREREIGIRISVGAGGGRLVRQLFTESVILASAGSAAGLALGYVVLRTLILLTEAPAWLDPAPDWPVVLFAVGIGFLAAILFGLTPALQLARQRHRRTVVREFLVAAQVAASCILLIVAGLLVRALNHATSANPGFEYERVLSVEPGLAGHGYSPEKARAYLDSFEGRLRALPGVESVSLALSPPLGNRSERAGVEVDGHTFDIQINRVDPLFLQTMKVPLLRGRNLTRGDAHSIVISDSLARRWPTGDPLGKKFTMGSNETVVGVAGSARSISLENSNSVEIYLLASPADLPFMSVVVRTRNAPESVGRAAASIAKSLDPEISPDVQLLKIRFRRKLQGAEYSAVTVGLLGFVALLIACLGIVGLVAYSVAQRTKEIGIRLALGAKPWQVLSPVLNRFFLPVIVGMAVGVGGAAALSQVLRRVLYGVSHLDPVTYLSAVGIFAATVALAALLPAARALRVDPMRALRYD